MRQIFGVFTLFAGSKCWEDSIFHTRAKLCDKCSKQSNEDVTNFGAELDYYAEGNIIKLEIVLKNNF